MTTTDARYHLAWLMWCYQEGYTNAEDRATTHNWLLDDPMTMHPDDLVLLRQLLAMADEVLAPLQSEIQRLGDDLENAYRLIRERHDIIGYERKLADDLAAAITGWFPFGDTGTYEVEQVMARYRAARSG